MLSVNLFCENLDTAFLHNFGQWLCCIQLWNALQCIFSIDIHALLSTRIFLLAAQNRQKNASLFNHTIFNRTEIPTQYPEKLDGYDWGISQSLGASSIDLWI
jgi:hypothetical protein